MVSHGVGWAWTALGMARWGRAGAFLRCLDLGMVPRGPSVGVGFAGARVRCIRWYGYAMRLGKGLLSQGNRALSGANWAAVRHCFNRRDHETRSRVAFSGERGAKKLYASHFRSFPLIFGHCRSFSATAADICNLVSRQACGEWGFENRNSVQHSFQVRDSS